MTGPGPAKPGSTPQARSTPGPSTPDEIDLSGPSHWATGALLGLIEQAAQGVLVLCEGLTRDELLGSRLTRTEVLRQLSTLTLSATQLDAAVQTAMPELDWSLGYPFALAIMMASVITPFWYFRRKGWLN